LIAPCCCATRVISRMTLSVKVEARVETTRASGSRRDGRLARGARGAASGEMSGVRTGRQGRVARHQRRAVTCGDAPRMRQVIWRARSCPAPLAPCRTRPGVRRRLRGVGRAPDRRPRAALRAARHGHGAARRLDAPGRDAPRLQRHVRPPARVGPAGDDTQQLDAWLYVRGAASTDLRVDVGTTGRSSLFVRGSGIVVLFAGAPATPGGSLGRAKPARPVRAACRSRPSASAPGAPAMATALRLGSAQRRRLGGTDRLPPD
jgi:hypothetical protein